MLRRGLCLLLILQVLLMQGLCVAHAHDGPGDDRLPHVHTHDLLFWLLPSEMDQPVHEHGTGAAGLPSEDQAPFQDDDDDDAVVVSEFLTLRPTSLRPLARVADASTFPPTTCTAASLLASAAFLMEAIPRPVWNVRPCPIFLLTLALLI